MSDLRRDWNHWSGAERMAAAFLFAVVIGLPALLLLSGV